MEKAFEWTWDDGWILMTGKADLHLPVLTKQKF